MQIAGLSPGDSNKWVHRAAPEAAFFNQLLADAHSADSQTTVGIAKLKGTLLDACFSNFIM